MIEYENISHIALEVTDLDRAAQFYGEVLGMEFIHRDQGELGRGRIVLRNGSGQLLLLEKVDALAPRSRFCGPDKNKVPDPGGPPRYSGAHLAMSVGSVQEYDEVFAGLSRSGVFMEGDILAKERAPGEKSVYFYDPFGNRLQLIILGAANQRSASTVVR
jgi:catechol 2,3-dioxygenase-like lactoylglutathione lyase family enzyme